MSSTESKSSTTSKQAKEPEQAYVVTVSGTSEIVSGFVGPFDSQADVDAFASELQQNRLGTSVEQFRLTDPDDVLDANPETPQAREWAQHAEALREEIKAAAEA